MQKRDQNILSNTNR